MTREDSRQILVARLREITKAHGLSEADVSEVLNNVVIVDLTSENFRLSLIAGDMVAPNLGTIDGLVDALGDCA